MVCVLAAGFSERAYFAIQNHFRGIPFKLAKSSEDVAQHLRTIVTSLLVIEHSINSYSSLELMSQVRAVDSYKEIPILYCVPRSVDQSVAKQIAAQIGFGKLEFHPVDWEKVAKWASDVSQQIEGTHEASGRAITKTKDDPNEALGDIVDSQFSVRVLSEDSKIDSSGSSVPILSESDNATTLLVDNISPRTDSSSRQVDGKLELSTAQGRANTLNRSDISLAKESESQNSVAQKMAALWGKFKGSSLDRVSTIENSVVALLKNEHGNESALEAQRDAHKLAGSLGTFGFAEGSRIAKEIELIFESGEYDNSSNAYKLSELALALRDEVEGSEPQQLSQPEDSQPARDSETQSHQVLIIDSSDEFAQQLINESAARGMLSQQVSDISSAKQYLSRNRPNAIILNLMFSGDREDGLSLLANFQSASTPIPCIVLGPANNFNDRIDVVRLGGLRYLTDTTSPQNILDYVEETFREIENTTTNIIAVDDDAQMLEILDAILRPQGINLVTLQDSKEFWGVLEKVSPQLVLLDLDMPNISGFDLCRVMRSDARWATVPVVFVTANNNPDIIREIFQAGADDYIAKPIVGPELTARIINRLERVDLLEDRRKVNPLTGLVMQDELEKGLQEIFNLADKYQQPASIAVLAVNQLDEFSNQFGRNAADKAMQRLGELLQRKFRGQNIAGHWDDNQFVIGVYGTKREDAVNRVSEVIELFRDSDSVGSLPNEIDLTLRAGISEYPANGIDVATLHAMASEALSMALSSEAQNVVAFGEILDDLPRSDFYDVVLVDDDEVLAELLLHTFETRGYTAHWIKNGHLAVELLGGDSPQVMASLVLMDVDMPGLSGLNALRQLAGVGFFERTRVIMLTARSIESETLTALELGAVDHISKPFSLPVLMQRIRRAME